MLIFHNTLLLGMENLGNLRKEIVVRKTFLNLCLLSAL